MKIKEKMNARQSGSLEEILSSLSGGGTIPGASGGNLNPVAVFAQISDLHTKLREVEFDCEQALKARHESEESLRAARAEIAGFATSLKKVQDENAVVVAGLEAKIKELSEESDRLKVENNKYAASKLGIKDNGSGSSLAGDPNASLEEAPIDEDGEKPVRLSKEEAIDKYSWYMDELKVRSDRKLLADFQAFKELYAEYFS